MENFDDLFSAIDKKVISVFAYGENREEIALSAKKFDVDLTVADDLEDATRKGFDFAKMIGAKNLLFSPASKSFDAFSNYEERGRFFDKVVKTLK